MINQRIQLRILLVILAVVTLAAQIYIVPAVAAGLARDYPEAAHLEVPYLITVIAAACGLEVALVASWRILSLLASDGPIRTSSVRFWVNLAAWGVCLMATLFIGIFVHASLESLGSPAMLVGFFASIAIVPIAVAVRRRFLRHVDFLAISRG